MQFQPATRTYFWNDAGIRRIDEDPDRGKRNRLQGSPYGPREGPPKGTFPREPQAKTTGVVL